MHLKFVYISFKYFSFRYASFCSLSLKVLVFHKICLKITSMVSEIWLAINKYLMEKYTYLLGNYYLLSTFYMLVALVRILCSLYHMIHIINGMKGVLSPLLHIKK